MSETPATELEAVNVILINMGEAPIDSLSGDLPLDAYKAQQVLKEVSRELQTRGWFWNREYTYLTPNVDGYIAVPTNALDVERYGPGDPLVMRDGYLYTLSPFNNGFTFEDSVQVRITYYLSFENLPQMAREFLMAKAARVFQARELGDDTLLRQDSAEEIKAWARLRAYENKLAKRSLREAYDTRMITDRIGAPLTAMGSYTLIR